MRITFIGGEVNTNKGGTPLYIPLILDDEGVL